MLITTKEVKKLNDIRDTLFFKIKEKKFSAVLLNGAEYFPESM